mgnify:CR=1 FL=1
MILLSEKMDKVEVSDILNDETEFQNIKNITQGYVNSSSKALQQLEQTGFGTLKDLKNDFKAKYVFLEKQRNPLFYYYLEKTPQYYKKEKDTVSEAVYLIK